MISIMNYLYEEQVSDHLKRNKGNYASGAAGLGVGALGGGLLMRHKMMSDAKKLKKDDLFLDDETSIFDYIDKHGTLPKVKPWGDID